MQKESIGSAVLERILNELNKTKDRLMSGDRQ